MQHCGDSPQPPQQFCLRWNNYQSNLTNVFDQLLQSESFVDVTLACDGHSIKAHKMVLSACSPYFRQLFFENPCQHPIIILKDINWPELKATVEFMYKGEINVSQDQIGPLLKVAENLKIRGLADVNGEEGIEAKSQASKKIGSGWDPKTSTLHMDESVEESGRASSPTGNHPSKKRRRKCSPERSSAGRNSVVSRDSVSSPEISPGAPDSLEAVALEMSPPPQPPIGINLSNHVSSHPQHQHSPARPQSRGQPHSAPPHLAAEPPSLPLPLPPTVPPPLPVDDMEIKPGIAEMIREEERAKLLESSHSWLGASTSTLAEYTLSSNPDNVNNLEDRAWTKALQESKSLNSKWTQDDLVTAIELVRGGIPIKPAAERCAIPVMTLWRRTKALGMSKLLYFVDIPMYLMRLRTPNWTQAQLMDAIQAVVTQRMRFTQAASRYGIPKGTLYDHILGKTKRMLVLEEAGLTPTEENAVLDFCCQISVSPFNRRTQKPLSTILNFVESIRQKRDPNFRFTGLSGFRWWWAFCKKHSIVSLYFETRPDDYQYQLQSMWQKCWNTNQSLVHNLRFRERGPLKSWRPETMAEAIFSVLKEGLSLSQAARKFDIPYPTFVLYANRVHNMLGPSADGGADLRPKGRGRPQRILLGVWPDEHIRGVIRAVVFRDPQHMKEDQHIGFPRLPDTPYLGNACGNTPDPSAAIAAVAHGLRQQMCNMVAAAHHHGDTGLVNSLNLLSHCNNLGIPTNGMRLNSPLGSAHDLRINSPGSREIDLSPASSPCNPLDGCAVNLSTNVSCKTESKTGGTTPTPTTSVGPSRSGSKSPPTEDYEVNLSTRHLSKSPCDEYDDIDDLVRSPRGIDAGDAIVRDNPMPLKVEITE